MLPTKNYDVLDDKQIYPRMTLHPASICRYSCANGRDGQRKGDQTSKEQRKSQYKCK